MQKARKKGVGNWQEKNKYSIREGMWVVGGAQFREKEKTEKG
jgi:hypothetical protein